MLTSKVAALVVDHVSVLMELESIGTAVTTLEQQYGPRSEFDDARRRLERVRADVVRQLGALADPIAYAAPRTVH